MKTPLLLSLFSMALSLGGCAALSTTQSAYTFDLEQASKTKTPAGELSVTELQQRMLLISFKNLGSETTKIVWDESAIVDTKGQTHRIIHGEVKMKDAGASMPPTIVPAGAMINDSLTYSDGVEYVAGIWHVSELVPCSGYGVIGCSRSEHIGRNLTLVLTTETGGKRREYTAVLKLKEVPEERPASSSQNQL